MDQNTKAVWSPRCAFIAAATLVVFIGFLYAFVNALFLRPVLWRRLPPLPDGSVSEILYAYTTYNRSRYCLEYKVYVKNDAGELYYWTGRDPYVTDGDWKKSSMSEVEGLSSSLPTEKAPCSTYADPPKVWWRKSVDSAVSCSDAIMPHVSRVRYYVLLSNGRVLMAASNDYIPLLFYPAVGWLMLCLFYFIVSVIRGYLHHLPSIS